MYDVRYFVHNIGANCDNNCGKSSLEIHPERKSEKRVKFASTAADVCRGGCGNFPVVRGSTPLAEAESWALS